MSLLEDVPRVDVEIALAGRNLEHEIDGARNAHFLLHRLGIGKHETAVAAVLLRRAVGRVVHLEDQLRAGRHEAGQARRQRLGPQSRGIRAQEVVAAAQAAAHVAVRRNHEQQDVVHDRGIARPRLDGRDPLVFLPARIDHEHLIFDHARGRHVERLVGHVDHLVGLGNHPAFGELGRLGQILGIALGRAVGDPFGDRGLVGVAQPGVVLEVAELLRRRARAASAATARLRRSCRPSRRLPRSWSA